MLGLSTTVMAALLLLCCSPARASVASISGSDVIVEDQAAEENVMVLSDRPDGFITITDEAGITAGSGCVDTMQAGVTCPSAGIIRVIVRAGAGDDHVITRFTQPALVSGGMGDDSLKVDVPYNLSRLATGSDVAESAINELDGGPGDDRLEGWLGDEQLDGGDGNDDLRGYGGTNTYAGGPGEDTVDYSDFTTPVAASLDGKPGDGPLPSLRDAIGPDVENLAGSRADDALIGNDGPNRLAGNLGDDRLTALAGADDLSGGSLKLNSSGGEVPARDVLDAGDGDDTIREQDRDADSIVCGGGIDHVLADPVDQLAADCEARGATAPAGPAPPAGPAGSQPPPATTPAPRVPRVSCASRKRRRVYRCRVTMPAAAGRTVKVVLSGRRTLLAGRLRAGRSTLTLKSRRRVRSGSYTLLVGRALYEVRVR